MNRAEANLFFLALGAVFAITGLVTASWPLIIAGLCVETVSAAVAYFGN